MSRIRYIGSKGRVSSSILDIITSTIDKNSGYFVDLFSGTGAISKEAVERGWQVKANDYLYSSMLITKSKLIDSNDINFKSLGGYSNAIVLLNKTREKKGFIYREYSPNKLSDSQHTRQYFSTKNAKKIDGIRFQIEKLFKSQEISETEYHLLIADLLEASNAVANIAGTYGCFMKNWTKNAKNLLGLIPRKLKNHCLHYVTTNKDSFTYLTDIEDCVYIDPPYTKRQYPAYYHILETIAYGDEPNVSGVTGLRPWKAKSSPFCFKKKAPEAFERIIQSVKSRNIFISYSSEGHVPITMLKNICLRFGQVEVYDLGQISRYTPNKKAIINSSEVTEYLIQIRKEGTFL